MATRNRRRKALFKQDELPDCRVRPRLHSEEIDPARETNGIPPFLGAEASKGNFIGRTTDAFTLGAGVKDGAIERWLEALLTEAKRVDDFGFLQSELDREKQNLLRGYERAFAERDKTQSAAFVQE